MKKTKPKAKPKSKAIKNKSAKSAGKVISKQNKHTVNKSKEQPQNDPFCSFCGKPYDQSTTFIEAPKPANMLICVDCIIACMKVVLDEYPSNLRYFLQKILSDNKQTISYEETIPL